ncbi:MAG TPA: MmcQ/YjbR family DNA-binding protein, partial [Flavisolibacter sp.]
MNIDFIRSICTKLPAATEDVKWDHDLVFSVGGKMFCAASLELPFTCSFKVPDEQFEEISNRQGFIPAPYLARARWVQVTNPAAM